MKEISCDINDIETGISPQELQSVIPWKIVSFAFKHRRERQVRQKQKGKDKLDSTKV